MIFGFAAAHCGKAPPAPRSGALTLARSFEAGQKAGRLTAVASATPETNQRKITRRRDSRKSVLSSCGSSYRARGALFVGMIQSSLTRRMEPMRLDPALKDRAKLKAPLGGKRNSSDTDGRSLSAMYCGRAAKKMTCYD